MKAIFSALIFLASVQTMAMGLKDVKYGTDKSDCQVYYNIQSPDDCKNFVTQKSVELLAGFQVARKHDYTVLVAQSRSDAGTALDLGKVGKIQGEPEAFSVDLYDTPKYTSKSIYHTAYSKGGGQITYVGELTLLEEVDTVTPGWFSTDIDGSKLKGYDNENYIAVVYYPQDEVPEYGIQKSSGNTEIGYIQEEIEGAWSLVDYNQPNRFTGFPVIEKVVIYKKVHTVQNY